MRTSLTHALLTPLLALAVLTAAPTDVHALEVTCEPYPSSKWLAAMDKIDGFLAEMNVKEANYIALDIEQNRIRCLGELVSPAEVTRFSRQSVVLGFLMQDEDRIA